jgi:hypothetical protein
MGNFPFEKGKFPSENGGTRVLENVVVKTIAFAITFFNRKSNVVNVFQIILNPLTVKITLIVETHP